MPNRIIKESICVSGSIDTLSWFEEVFFYRLIVNCDDYGRMDARPAVVRARLFPLKDITTKQIEGALSKLATAGMVRVYEYDRQPYLQLENWSKHQSVRNKRSKYPDPDAPACTCKQLHANVPVIQSESESESESNTTAEAERARARIDPQPLRIDSPPDQPPVFDSTPETSPNAFADSPNVPRPDSLEAYISNYVASTMTDSHWRQLDDLLQAGMPDDLIKLAIDEACAQGKSTWAYINSILNRWLTSGVKNVAQARQKQAEFKATKTQTHSRDRPDRPPSGPTKFFDGGSDGAD